METAGSRCRLLYFTGWQEAADTATVLKEQLAAIGIAVELVLLEYAAWEEQMAAGDFDLSLQGGFQGPDPANLALRWGTGATLNRWGYSSPEFDELLIQGDAASSQEERAPLYFEAQAILAADLPSIPLPCRPSSRASPAGSPESGWIPMTKPRPRWA